MEPRLLDVPGPEGATWWTVLETQSDWRGWVTLIEGSPSGGVFPSPTFDRFFLFSKYRDLIERENFYFTV